MTDRNVVRGSTLGLIGQAWHLLTALALYAYLARRFGPAIFGDWRVALTVLTWFEIVMSAGIAKVATMRIGERPEAVRPFGRAAYLGQAVVAVAVWAALTAAAGPIAAALGNPALATTIRFAALDIPLYGLFMVASAVVLGTARFERQAVAWIVYATAKAVFIAVLATTPLSVAGAFIGNALSSAVGLAAMWVPLRARAGDAGAAATSGAARDAAAGGADAPDSLATPALARILALASLPFLTLALLDGLGMSADLWIVSAVVGGAPVGLYAAAALLAEVPVFLFLGLNRVIFPAVAAAMARGAADEAARATRLGVRAGIVVAVFGVGIAAGAGRWVLEFLFSSEYAAAWLPLVLLMGAGLGRTVMATCNEVLMARGRRRAALTVLACAVGAEALLVVVSATRWGIVGAAAGAAIAAAGGATAGTVLLRDALGWRPLATLARAAVAAALTTAPLALLPQSGPAMVAGAPLAAVAYVLVLRVIGEIRPADIAALRGAAAAAETAPDPAEEVLP